MWMSCLCCLDICSETIFTESASGYMELGMAAGSVRYLCSCGTAALISYFGNRSCYCHSAATRAVKPRSHSCIPVRIQSPTSASVRVPNFDKWLSTTGASKSSLKDWMQYLSRFYPHVDVSSMSRALTSLHVDLPRSFPEIRRLVPSISVAQLQHIFHRTNSPGHYSVTGSSNQQSTLNSKSLADSAKPSSTEARRSPVHSNSNRLRYEEQPVAESPVSAVGKDDETKTSTASTQQHVISEAVTLPADKSRIIATTSTAPATDSVMTKVNTVASGIARQFAEYMPTVNTNTAAQTKSPTFLQQHRESLEIDSREKAKADEVKNETSAALPKQTSIRRQVVARASSDRQTCGLVLCLRNASTSTSQLVRLEELCQHISQYPDCTGIAVKVC